jgi:hypothetical protein
LITKMAEFFDREAELSNGSEDEEVRSDVRNKKKSRNFEDSEEEEEDGKCGDNGVVVVVTVGLLV